MVYVQRKGHPQLWVPIEKLLSVGSILRGGLPHANSDTREGPLWNLIFSTLQASVWTQNKVVGPPQIRNTTADQWL